MRNDKERWQDILESIEKIEKYLQKGKDKFYSDELIQTYIIHHLLIIGEAANHVSENVRKQYNNVPWVGTIDVRNIIAHEYFRVDLDIIWNIVQKNLPDLKRKIREILVKIG